jgi:GT2 family glycosyltransferase
MSLSKKKKIKKYDTKIEIYLNISSKNEDLLKQTIKSILKQSYKNWHLYIVIKPEISRKTLQITNRLSKSKCISLIHSEHYVEGVKSINGGDKESLITFIQSGDKLQVNALLESVMVINSNTKTSLIYSDSDFINNDGRRIKPFFKPDWSPDMFLSTNYLAPFILLKRALFEKVGGLRSNYWEATNYDLLLRATEEVNEIIHIPKVLYSQSIMNKYSNKKRQLLSLKDALKRRHLKASVSKGLIDNSFRVKYEINGEPLVSIIIPTKDKPKIFKACLSSILKKTSYQNYEILIVDTGSIEKETLNFYKKIEKNKKIRFLKWDKAFNYSAVNNYAVEYSKGDYLLFLNNDTEIISKDWIQGLLEHAQRENVGAVGAKLYYPNDTLQHAGIVVGLFDSAGHIMQGAEKKPLDLPYTKDIIRNWSAVTAACLMIEREKFEMVNGFDENLKIALNDVDFCLKLLNKGLFNVYTPYSELYHYESLSVGKPWDSHRNKSLLKKEIQIFTTRWGNYITNDPYFNPNYDKYNFHTSDFTYKIRLPY